MIDPSQSALNGEVIRTYDVPLALQNTVLYTLGIVFNVAGYALTSPMGFGAFFNGFGAVLTWLVILNMSSVGLLVTFVYKHADPILKNFASSLATAVLLVAGHILLGTVRLQPEPLSR